MEHSYEYDKSKEMYLGYIYKHQFNVRSAYYNYISKIDIPVKYDKNELIRRINNHDRSKTDEEEFEAYRKYFYTTENEIKDEEAFNEAWKHHYSVNDHHPEHWINDKGEIKEMKIEAAIEMICDWIAMSINFHNNPLDWYKKAISTKEIELHPNTQELVEKILNDPVIKESTF